MKHFWQMDSSPHVAIFDALSQLKQVTDERLTLWQRLITTYENKFIPLVASQQISDAEIREALYGREKQLALNPIENCVSTLGSRIASQRPRASFMTATSGPDGWKIKHKAENLEKFVAGEWSRCKLYGETITTFFDGAIMGLGHIHVYEFDGKLCFERVPPWEIIVDENACRLTPPRTAYRVKSIPAELLIAKFCRKEYPKEFREKNEAAIEAAVGEGAQIHLGKKITTDLVQTVEAWHLPSGYGNDDGRHIICVNNRTLTQPSEWKWEINRFPFATFRIEKPIVGYFPQGIVEKHENIQQQINKLLKRVQEAMHLYSVANTYAEEGSINKADLENTSGNVVWVKRGMRMPIVAMPPSINSEVFNFINTLDQKVYHSTGVSQLSAASIKPAGIESGRALRVLHDVEGGRHALVNLAWDDFFVDLAELTVEAAKIVYSGGEYKTKYRRGKRVEEIAWKDVDMERDAYDLQVFPTSMLPYEPAGRLATVEEMLSAGFISREQALSLLSFPDLEQFTSLEVASIEDYEMTIYEMLINNEYYAPETYQNLELGMKMMTSALLRARVQKYPDEKIELLTRWLSDAQNMIISAQNEQMQKAQAMQAQAQPQGPPMQAMQSAPMQ